MYDYELRVVRRIPDADTGLPRQQQLHLLTWPSFPLKISSFCGTHISKSLNVTLFYSLQIKVLAHKRLCSRGGLPCARSRRHSLVLTGSQFQVQLHILYVSI